MFRQQTGQKVSLGIFKRKHLLTSKIEFCLEARLVGEQLEISSRVSSSWNEILMPDPRGSLLAYFTIWRWSNGDRMREKTVSILDAGHNQKMLHSTLWNERRRQCWWHDHVAEVSSCELRHSEVLIWVGDWSSLHLSLIPIGQFSINSVKIHSSMIMYLFQGSSCVSLNFGHNVALLALAVNLAFRWPYLHCL